MHRNSWFLGAVLLTSSSGLAVVVDNGGTLFTNPYDTDRNYALDGGVTHAFGDPATGAQGNWQLGGGTGMAGAFDSTSSSDTAGWTWLTNLAAGENDGDPVFAQWSRGSTFPVGTILHDVVRYPYPNIQGSADYQIKLANGSPGTTSAAWNPVAAAATASTGTTNGAFIRVSTLPTVVTADTLRMEFSSTTYRDASAAPNSHAFIDEVVVLPDRYVPVPIVSADISGEGAFPREHGYDRNIVTRWYHQSGGDEFITFNLGSEQRIDALVVYTYPNFPSDFSVMNGATEIARVTNVTASPSEVLAIKLDNPVVTSALTLKYTTNQNSGVGGLNDVVLLQQAPPIPEPATLAALAPLAGLLAMRRRVR